MPSPLTGPYHRPTRHRLGLLFAAGLAVAGLAACSTESQSADQVFQVGCPAVDAAAAGGSTINQAAVKALEAARDSGQLDPEPAKWADAAIDVLTTPDSGNISADARKLLIDGCAKHGYTLKNLS